MRNIRSRPIIEVCPTLFAAGSGDACSLSDSPHSKHAPVFEPLPVHLELEQRDSRMIRVGYLARDRRFVAQLHENADLIGNTANVPLASRSTATGFTILGISGVGKTTAVERILSLYPQVIGHHEYQGRPLTVMQVVWLKLDCPFDGSIKGLCLNFFQVIDDSFGRQG